MKDVCLVIPIYQKTPTYEDIIAIESVKKHFKIHNNVFFIAPKGLDISEYVSYGFQVKYFKKKYFKSEDTYSKLLLTTGFYSKFSEYQYMIICQTDAILLRDWDEKQLEDFGEYDYIGAPWHNGNIIYSLAFKGVSLVKQLLSPKCCYVGNGGLSFRNIEKSIAVLKRKHLNSKIWNSGEDTFFAYCGMNAKNNFSVAPIEIAMDFALEKESKERMEAGARPFGIHAWKKFYPELIENGTIF